VSEAFVAFAGRWRINSSIDVSLSFTSLVTPIFLHAGILHLLGNLFFQVSALHLLLLSTTDICHLVSWCDATRTDALRLRVRAALGRAAPCVAVLPHR
jgi:hypothetical protein